MNAVEFGKCIEYLVECNEAITRRRSLNELRQRIKVFNRSVRHASRRARRLNGGRVDLSSFLNMIRKRRLHLQGVDSALDRGRIALRPTIEVEDEGDVITGKMPVVVVTGLRIDFLD